MPDTPTPAPDDALAALRRAMPIALGRFDPAAQRTGLVIVDIVNGFATVGRGPLAPPAPNAQVDRMIAEADALARRFAAAGWPVLATRDSHDPDRPEPPYPPHCLRGTGDDELVPALEWLESAPQATILPKDCINTYVGAIETAADGSQRNRLLDWIAANRIEALLVTGICTDICVMDFVLTLLSARNHGLTAGLRDIWVYERACATYDLPLATAQRLGLPETAAHPQAEAHHMGLYFMASRGAALAGEIA
ncbi:MAG TPA: isochorismatase family protein [Alphaproteobacteria bacterium]|nr:isochorismatase family protein [Alphaproteobacteria bacterium]